MQKVEIHHPKEEEGIDDQQGQHAANGDNLKRDVALRALHLSRVRTLALHLMGGQRYGAANDAPALHDADDAGHGDGADAHATRITGEDGLRTHVAYGGGNGGIPLVEHRVGEDDGHERHDNPPHKHRTGADDSGIAQANDVAQAQHSGSGVHLQHQLGLVGKVLTETYHA